MLQNYCKAEDFMKRSEISKHVALDPSISLVPFVFWIPTLFKCICMPSLLLQLYFRRMVTYVMIWWKIINLWQCDTVHTHLYPSMLLVSIVFGSFKCVCMPILLL